VSGVGYTTVHDEDGLRDPRGWGGSCDPADQGGEDSPARRVMTNNGGKFISAPAVSFLLTGSVASQPFPVPGDSSL